MANLTMPRSFLPHSRAERAVNGLREFAEPSEVKVYQQNPDGSRGKLLRIEQAKHFTPNFTRSKLS